MTSYYQQHYGNLYPGDIAKAQDINQIQTNIADMIDTSLNDLHDGQGCILGENENAFVLTPETKRNTRFIDQMNLAEGSDGKYISIRETDYRQLISMSRSSLYSVIVKMQNKSEKDVSVVFELHDTNSNLIEGKKAILNLPKKTDPTEYEIVFDLEYYPTAHGLKHEDLESNDNQVKIPLENSNDTEGIDHGDEQSHKNETLGATQVYLVVRALNKNKFDINQSEDGYIWNDEDPTFGILMNTNSSYGQLLEQDNGDGFVKSDVAGDLYFKTVYSNYDSYHCEYGEALIGGQKVCLASTHVSVEGASAYGNIISYIYMDITGILHAKNSEPFLGATPTVQPPDEPHLHIANIITYADSSESPIIYQDDTNQDTRPRSHHERLRRLEKKMSYMEDIAIPPRIKYTLTGDSWVDKNPGSFNVDGSNLGAASDLDVLKEGDGYVLTTDSNGNFIIKVTKAESFNIPITLKSTTSGITETKNKKTILKSAQTSSYINSLSASDITRAQTFSEIKNMDINITNGIMTLSSNESDSGIVVATNAKEAKETEFNPWDDSARNRPKSSKIKPTQRAYTVTSGKNGKHDWASEFPAMTFYTSKNYNLKKLEIPIYKFKNCSGVKFIIYRRQDSNSKKNTVWLQKRIWVTDTFSLKKAKIKGGYQYMDDGFLIDFGKKGLTLSKGQYVIIALPIAKSGQGTMYVDTYKPENSKDFCIRYYGAANASHFLLKTRYQEIWYNPAKAIGEEITYNTNGSVTSGTITWTNKEPIKTIKPTANVTIPKGTSCKLEVDVGSGWQAIEFNKVNTINSGKTSFRWRLTFKGNKKTTPTLKYNSKNKYAINFLITRATPHAANTGVANTLDKNLCVTSIPFDGNKILREYLNDMNLALSDNKLSNYEFARVWATDNNNKELRIDLAGSDRKHSTLGFPIYSLHYSDLKLEDFNSGSVEYSNYDPLMELDEHNLRLKLDTEYSYNDDDIKILNINEFEVTNNEYKLETPTTTETQETTSESESESEETTTVQSKSINIDATKIPTTASKNLTLLKAKLDSPINLAQFDAIKVGLSIDGTVGGTISGLALYVSSSYEEKTPSNIENEPDLDVAILDTLPDLNNSQEETIAMYANQIVKRYEPRNGTAGYVYYQSIWDSANKKWTWSLIHNNNKSYEIYELIDKTTKTGTLTVTNDNKDKEQYYEIYIDPNKTNLQYAKEIGLIVLNDEKKYAMENVSSIKLHEFITIQQDYYPVFDASGGDTFNMLTSDAVSKANKSGSISLVGTTTPETAQVTIGYKNISTAGQRIAEFDAASKNTKNYNHIGIQLASDCLLVKNMLELHLIQVDDNGVETVIDKLNLPTNNYIYYPMQATDKNINLIQIFKKLETNERFDKIALVTTSNFVDYATKLKTIGEETNGIDGNKSISLFIGKISLYQARYIPMFHPVMRMKFYFDQTTEDKRDVINIRKIGVVADFQ